MMKPGKKPWNNYMKKIELIIFDWNGTLSQMQFAQEGGVVSELYPEVPHILHSLDQQGYLLAIATNMSRAGIERELAHHHLAAYFVYVATLDQAPAKPNPQMLFDILDFTGVDAEHALMVGDTSADEAMAAAAGTDFIRVVSGVNQATLNRVALL